MRKPRKTSAGALFPDLSLGQAERPAVRRRFPLTLKGEPGRSPDPLQAISELFEDGSSWVEKKAGERTGVKSPVLGTMSGSARPLFWGISG